MKAVIMAGGSGTRLLPLTEDTPKSLVSINRKPFLWYIINNLKEGGISEILIIYGSKKAKFEIFLKEYDIDAKLIYQDEPLGTAHALKMAQDDIDESSFLVLGGDQLFSVKDITEVINSSEANCLSSFFVEDVHKYGLLEVKNSRLINIIEKPEDRKSGQINASLYKFDKKIFYYINILRKSERGEYELTDAISLLNKDKPIYVRPLNDFWMDLGCVEDVPIIEERLSSIDFS